MAAGGASDGKQQDDVSADVPVVNFGGEGIIRCKKCRTYINPFVLFKDNGRRWECNICGFANDVRSSYFAHLDSAGNRIDTDQRPELCKGQVEFVAPAEYMVRPPQAPVYVFVIDVSYMAVSTGMFAQAVEAIKDSLDDLQGGARTQVGFITFDSAVHFYNLKSSLSQPQMLVVSDIDELFLPIPDDLLVNLADSRDIVESLLDALPEIHKATRNVETCMGPALNAAFRVMSHIGGKMCVFLSGLPTVGEGRLKHRENPKLLGTEQEHSLLVAQDPYYKNKAVEFSRQQISVELFLTAPQFTDVAALNCLPKYTGGTLFYYPGYTTEKDGPKFSAEIKRVVSRTTAWESVMRVRVTRGMVIKNFHGNFFIRGQDLLALPNCNEDAAFAIELDFDEPSLGGTQVVSVQAALLYTTSAGERRIRVTTIAAPVTSSLADVYDSADIDTLVNVMSKASCETALKTGLPNARNLLQRRCVDIVRGYRSVAGGGGGGMYGGGQQQGGQAPMLPNSLSLLPLYSMALQKNVVFRGGNNVKPDVRSAALSTILPMPIAQHKILVYASLYSLHNMPNEAGTVYKSGDEPKEPSMRPSLKRLRCGDFVLMPPVVGLAKDKLNSGGIFMMDNGLDIYLWVGRAVVPQMLGDLIGLQSLEGVPAGSVRFPEEPLDNDLSKRVCSIIAGIRDGRGCWPAVHVIKEGSPEEQQVRRGGGAGDGRRRGGGGLSCGFVGELRG